MQSDRVRLAGTKRTLARFLAGRLAGRVVGGLLPHRIPSRGMRLFYPPWLLPQMKAMLFWGIYESAEIRFVQRYLRADFDAIELGSGIGCVSSAIGRKLAKGKKLVCVECDPKLPKWIGRT
jgi:hypothetical protein